MCELLGLNANVPTDICFSFTGLVQRGGATGPHRDGWGISMYDGKASRSFHDPRASVASEIAELIQRHSIKSKVIISHIRKANRGKVCLANTHPFERKLWGASWVFAHNGQLRGVKKKKLDFYTPVGTTDSEYAFCWMLEQIRKKFRKPPSDRRRLWRFIRKLAQELDELGVFSFLLSDSQVLYAYCSNYLYWITRRHPFGKARLLDTGAIVDFSGETTPKDIVTVVTSQPLTDNEEWNRMEKGEFLVFKNGDPQEF
ncbi:MAG: class II glutamine amidotransferase [Gammaproteobacteria bacterium]